MIVFTWYLSCGITGLFLYWPEVDNNNNGVNLLLASGILMFGWPFFVIILILSRLVEGVFLLKNLFTNSNE